MCGIAGIVRLDGSAVDPAALRQMAAALRHRGPDESAIWTGSDDVAGIGFAHTRLSIIDIEASHQPMSSHDGRYVIAFNGEILNYRELREQLDYPWATTGDTEVLLAAFICHGPAAFTMLAGQFACAILDQQDGSLWLARDRMGILPLFWWSDGSALAFASEPKALVPVIGNLGVNPAVLREYLLRRAVPAPSTLYAGVNKLLPGSHMVLRRDATTEVERYWSPDAVSTRTEAVEPAQAVTDLESALLNAVERNLVADVPVGCYLSGGVDSSLITALTTAIRPPSVRTETFAAGFGDPRTDEFEFARSVADHLRTSHHEVRIGAADFEELWPFLTRHRDAPVSEPADVAVHQLAEAAGEHVKVVLSGEGSDELFAGYPKHRFAGMTSAAARIPVHVRAPLLTVLERGLPASLNRARIAARALTGHTETDLLRGWFSPFTTAEIDRLAGTGGRPVAPGSNAPSKDPLTRMLLEDLQAWLPDNLLERGDRMSMAASVELRPPFLDRDVVDLALTLPSDLKIRNGSGKWILKEVARSYLPAPIVDRPKAGFKVPLDAWFRDGLRDMAWSLLTDPQSLTTTMLDGVIVRRMLSDHDSGRRNEGIRLWTLLSLEVWHRTCVLGDPAHSAGA